MKFAAPKLFVSQFFCPKTLFGTVFCVASAFLAPSASAQSSITVINANDSGAGSLRAAIITANSSVADTINFRIPGAGVHTINLLTSLPTITQSLTIDGSTQSGSSSNTGSGGFDAVITIQLNGAGIAGSSTGLAFDSNASDSLVRGLALNRFSSAEILFQGGSGHNVEGCIIGLDANGTTTYAGSSGPGIALVGTTAATIGGASVTKANLISGNGGNGVALSGAGIRNGIYNNFIGVNGPGNAARGNGGAGISTAGTISATISSNLISGNKNGILLQSDGNDVLSNHIGTDSGFDVAIPNTASGIRVESTSNTIGQPSGGANTIAGNGGDGILFTGASAADSSVDSNGIGVTSPTLGNTHILANGGNGIFVTNAGTGISIGSNAFNEIYASGGWGIRINNSDQTGVFQNTIGAANIDGQNAGNSSGGILIEGTTSQSFVTGATIESNGGPGIAATGGTQNRLSQNSISTNTGLGIDLGNNGVTANDNLDADSGANNLQNFPILTSLTTPTAGAYRIQGLMAGAPNTDYEIEVFGSPSADPTGFGEGATYLLTVSVTTDANGQAAIDTGTQFGNSSQFFTATATDDGTGDTSEFSRGITFSSSSLVVTNTNDSGSGSLRNAIAFANNNIGTDTITFAIPGGGVQTIAPTSALPTITDTVVIDGTSQPGASLNTLAQGSNAVLTIEINGTGAAGDGLTVSASNSTVRGLVINRFTGNGIVLSGAGVTGSTVEGCFIGTNAAGTAALANNVGVLVSGSTDTVGGATAATRNIISGNTNTGVLIRNASGNTVSNNLIGLGADGTTRLKNISYGVWIDTNSTSNTIGGNSSTLGNVISGNGTGVRIESNGNTANVVGGNIIGLAADGDTAVGNTQAGVTVLSSSNGVGGASVGFRNTISGNGGSGVDIIGPVAGVLVRFNYIGTDKTGLLDRGNLSDGVRIVNASNNTIGGTGVGNVLSGNLGSGLEISTQAGGTATGNQIESNAIGTDGTGAGIHLGNDSEGVYIDAGAADNLIGGAGVSNTIAYNSSVGIRVGSTAGTGNRLSRNLIFQNGGIGIDLGGDGAVTPNDLDDPDTGPNNFQNYPVLGNVTLANGNTSVAGMLNSLPNTSFTLEFFSDSSPDATGFGEGEVFIGSQVVTTDAGGDIAFTFAVAGTFTNAISATATPNGAPLNTSEFSRSVTAPLSTVVTNTNDSGAGSLRQAILNANANTGADTISFAIPGAAAVVRTIAPTSALPNISGPTTIDGYSQSGASANTLASGDNAVILIELSGANAPGAIGLNITGGNSTVRGLAINGFGNSGVLLDTNGTNTIAGCFIGTNTAGTLGVSNLNGGVLIQNGSTNNVIGGTTAAARNVISGNNNTGVHLDGGATTGNKISGNYIGTNAAGTGNIPNVNSAGIYLSSNAGSNTIGGTTGTTPGGACTGACNLISGNGQQGLDSFGGGGANIIQGNFVGTNGSGTGAIPNGNTGIYLNGAGANNIIGGTTPAARNLVSGNNSEGINLADYFSLTSGTVIQGNFIGTDTTGTTALGNGQDGIYLRGINTTVGGTAAGAGNIIAFNGARGVAVSGPGNGGNSTGTAIRGNSIHDNNTFTPGNTTIIEIDLNSDGVTPNDSGDADTGANNLQNFPDIASVTISGGNTIVTGTLATAPGVYAVDLYSNTAADASGNGGGETFEATQNVTVPAGGSVAFSFTRPGSINKFFALTATSAANDTSEFSRSVRAPQNYVVDTVSDANLTFCSAAAGDCSLRGAINNANANAGADTISFAIPGGGVQTIAPTSALPTITGPVTINGYSQTSSAVNTSTSISNATILIELNGTNAGGAANGLRLLASGSGSTIRGLVINRFAGFGILLSDSDNNTISGNFIGTDATGLIARANGAAGIEGESGTSADTNLIGGTTPAARNVISGNTDPGIEFNSGGVNNIVQGNIIGLGADGVTALGNSAAGIVFAASTSGTVIGGDDATDGTTDGVVNARNLISNNSGPAIALGGAGFGGATVRGNYLGTDVSGTLARPDVGGGMFVNQGSNTVIGGSTAGAGNLISGNGSDGIGIVVSSGIVIKGNRIGTKADGVSALGNTIRGILFNSGPNVAQIGGTAAGEGNVIAFNGADGIEAFTGSQNVTIRGNSLFSNGTTASHLGIDLDADGVNTNDTKDLDTGPNGIQNYPVITSVVNGTNSVVSGTLNSVPGFAYNIDIFSNTAADTSGFGEGKTYLGSATTTTTDTNGNATFTFTATAVNLTGKIITATATDTSGNTSEFSAAFSPPLSTVVINTNDAGAGSLRQAILNANANTGTDTISFAITPPGGVKTITPTSALPTLTGPTTIDGYTQSGASTNTLATGNNAVLTVELNGTGAGAGVSGLTSITSNVVIRGLVINRFPDNGVLFNGASAVSNTVAGCFIGTNAAGTAALPNGTNGVAVDLGGDNNIIGGTTAAARNVISGNTGVGVKITTPGSTGNLVQGNYIGTDLTGTLDLGNAGGGIYLDGAASTSIGGNVAGAGNVVSGNGGNGILLSNGTNLNTVSGNRIGTNAAGTADLGNDFDGVTLDSANTNNTIGGTTALERNIISGNNRNGVNLDNRGAVPVTNNNNTVSGNYIGTDVTGTLDLGNTSNGVAIQTGASNNTIGGATVGARNIISGNDAGGVYIGGGDANSVQNNYIGTNAAGTAVIPDAGRGLTLFGTTNALIGTVAGNVIAGHSDGGVYIQASNNTLQRNKIGTAANGSTQLGNTTFGIGLARGATGNLIGGPTAAQGNTIAFNTGDGIQLSDTATTGNSIRANSIFSNGDLGIDLNADGVTANDTGDADTGPNNLQNFPVITSVTTGSGNVTVSGTLNSTASTTFAIDLFAAQVDTTRFGEGRTFQSTQNVTTDGSGNAPFSFTLAGTFSGVSFTATATNTNTLDTSEFSRTVGVPQTFEVDTTSDANLTACTTAAGDCSLRGAINAANANFGEDTISFEIPGTAGAVRTITPTTALPDIIEAVTIDGYTQSGALTNTQVTTDNAKILIELSGGGISANGLNFIATNSTTGTGENASGSTVRGLAVNGFGFYGISLSTTSNTLNNITIQGNLIGTDATGLLDRGNGQVGVGGQFFAGTTNVTIGGTMPAARNVISGNGQNGVDFTTSSGMVIRGNFIGLGADGNTVIANAGGVGIGAFSGPFTIGGDDAADGAADGVVNARNIISGNTGSGIGLGGAGGANSGTIRGNYIGTNAAGTLARPNANGISADLANDAVVGGTTAGAGNLISGNSNIGLNLGRTPGWVVIGNKIGTAANGTSPLGNGGSGINLFLADTVQIGGTAAGEGNIIAFNGADGVESSSGTGNSIRGNSIFSNGTTANHLGIDLGTDGVTPNDTGDADTGPNNLQNFPVLNAPTFSGGNTLVTGTLNSTASTQFSIELFRNPATGVAADAEGQIFVARQNVSTDASGNASFTFTIAGTFNDFFTATATRTATPFDTSEFSPAVALLSTVVTNTNDAGVGSLRQAILNSNSNVGADTITFNIPGTGVQTITVGAASLPTIQGAVTINGFSQTGSSANTNATGALNATPLIVINGVNNSSIPTGLRVQAPSAIRGLVVQNFAGQAGYSGILLEAGASGTQIAGCFIGTDATGATAAQNNAGIRITGGTNYKIGGLNAADRNLISGNGGQGAITLLNIAGTATTPSVTIQGNLIGLNKSGNAAIPNGLGISFDNSPFGIVGGTSAAARNVLSATSSNPNLYLINGSSNTTVQGNYFNTDATGATGVGAVGGSGTSIFTANNLIGGAVAGAGNVFSGGGLNFQDTPGGNTVQGNIIGLNAAGTAVLSNNGFGLSFLRASGNTIGGATALSRNVIAVQNTQLSLSSSNNNTVQGNFIGLSAAGNALTGFSSAGVGISVADGSNNQIGGTVAGSGNAIGGSTRGIVLSNASNTNTIQGNKIGTNAAGAVAVPNGAGIFIVQPQGGSIPTGNTIGGTSAGAGNLISGNSGVGINFSGAQNTTIQGNFIGTSANGTTALPNKGDGIDVFVGANAGTLIGGASQGAGNVIAFNGNNGSGVGIRVFSGTGNAIRGNSIHDNAELGIDLPSTTEGANRVTPNDAGDADTGPNNLQNYPVINAIANGNIIGSLNSTPNANFTLDFYSNTAADASGFGEGATGVYSDVVTTDANGNVNFSFSTGSLATALIAATATNQATGDTSEFSRTFVPASGPTVTGFSPTSGTRGAVIFISGTGFTGASAVSFGGGLTTNFTVVSPTLIRATLPATATTGPISVTTGAGTGTSTTNFTVAATGYIVTNTNDTGAGSLREAINFANANTGADTISFAIPSAQAISGVYTIKPASGLPTLLDNATTIDASTQAGFSTKPIVVLNGNLAGAGAYGLHLNASNCTIKSLVINGFSFSGIGIDGGTWSGNTVRGCYIGTDANGTAAIPNANEGITIFGGPHDNVIGGASAAARNVISGNTRSGVAISGTGTNANSVRGNFIGTNAAGNAALANRLHGVVIFAGAKNNVIGGSQNGQGNLVSGNTVDGIAISDAGSNANLILGNIIGLDTLGTAKIANSGIGVNIVNGAKNNIVGGASAGARNVVSGNGSNGIGIGGSGGATSGSGTTGNKVQGNYVGTDITGTLALGNGLPGVAIGQSANNNLIGGPNAGEGNLVSGGASDGVSLFDAGTSQNTVQGNRIGTKADGLSALPNITGVFVGFGATNNTVGGAVSNLISGNSANGVQIQDSGTTGNTVYGNAIGLDKNGNQSLPNTQNGVLVTQNAAGNFIGGLQSGQGNAIYSNGKDGVRLESGTGNRVRGNKIYANTQLGINIVPTGEADNTPTLNDAGDADSGPNNGQNFPIVTSAAITGSQTTVNFTLNSLPSTTFAVDFYSTSNPDQSQGYGEGEFYLGTQSATTNAAGNVSSTFTFNQALTGLFVAATATNTATGDTSEFSLARATAATSFVVTNTNDSGAGSLRQAILNANAQSGAATITFNIPGTGVQTIAPLTALPAITDPVTINGYSQPGASANTSATGTNAVLRIQISGNPSISGAGLTITGANSTIKGLVINGFNRLSGGLGDGNVQLIGALATGNTIQGCFLGANAAGTAAAPGLFGVDIINGAHANTIGGMTPAARNLISGNQITGIGIGVGANDNGLSNNNVVQGNLIGTDKTGVAALPNGTTGTFGSSGVFFQRGAKNNVIGGTAAGAGNVIAFNTGFGVGVVETGTTGNAIEGNSIFGNSGLGIDLNGDGATPNDAGDSDSGPNNLQNSPNLGTVTSANSSITVTGTLDSAPGSYRLEFFSNPASDPSGEGKTFLKAQNLTVTAGSGTFTATIPGTFASKFITATATDSGGNTSEFSSAVRVGATSFVVTNTNATGAGSLAQAVIDANADADASTITFNIPGTGLQTIRPPFTSLEITAPVTINGFSQPGATPNTALINAAVNAKLVIQIQGEGFFIRSTAGGTTLKGLVINGINGDGVEMENGADDCVIQGCFIGTSAQGEQPNDAEDLNGSGLRIASRGNTIGGILPANRNVMGGGNGAGIDLENGANSNTVQGNFLQVGAGGTTSFDANGDGIYVQSDNNTIGGTDPQARNVLSAGNGSGITVRGSNNTILRNSMGTNAAGNGALTLVSSQSNQNGVTIFDGQNNKIGDGTLANGNIIAFNKGFGLTSFVTSFSSVPTNPTGNTFRGNLIYANGQLGIDLVKSGDGIGTTVTPNDTGDTDTGPNGLQNFPVITSATVSGNNVTIAGTINTKANTSVTIDAYSTPLPSPVGSAGQAYNVVGSQTVTTNGSGNANFTVTGPTSGFTRFAATATTSEGTSEFSQVFPNGTNPTLSLSFAASTVAEGGTVLATLTRTGNTSAGLTVSLAANPTGQLRVPTTVVFTAGQSGRTFNVVGETDGVTDGNVLVNVSASATGYSPGAASITVTDVPTTSALLVSLPTTVQEGVTTAYSGTVSRGTAPTTSALTVSLAANPTGQLNLPVSVTIPVGAAAQTFSFNVVNDARTEAAQTVTVTASATGFNNGMATTQVIDDDPAGSDLYAWGYNQFGQIGNGTTINQSLPVRVNVQVRSFAARGSHTLAALDNGTVKSWGYNGAGQLGDGSTTDKTSPVVVSGLSDVQAVASGWYHSLAVKTDGTVWAWGYNAHGQLGDNSTINRLVPTRVLDLTNVKAIAAGVYFSLALKSDGTVWGWGSNFYGQLTGDSADVLRPRQIAGIAGVAQIAADGGQALFLKSDGTVWACGWNQYGQLGNGSNTDSATPTKVVGLSGITGIAAGYVHGLALNGSGQVFGWGNNFYGQLGMTGADRNTPAVVSALSSIAQVAAGANFSVVRTTSGSARAFGSNVWGQRGDGTSGADNPVPSTVGNLSSVSVVGAGYGHGLALGTGISSPKAGGSATKSSARKN